MPVLCSKENVRSTTRIQAPPRRIQRHQLSTAIYTKDPTKDRKYKEVLKIFCVINHRTVPPFQKQPPGRTSVAVVCLLRHRRSHRGSRKKTTSSPQPKPGEAPSLESFDKIRKRETPRWNIGRGHTPSFSGQGTAVHAGEQQERSNGPSTAQPPTRRPTLCISPRTPNPYLDDDSRRILYRSQQEPEQTSTRQRAPVP